MGFAGEQLHLIDPHPTVLARATDPVTSHLAAARVREFAKGHREVILDCLREHGAWARRVCKRVQHQIRSQRLVEARARGTHTNDEWQVILERFAFRCVRCGCCPEPRPCKNHIVPISIGGSDAKENLQPLCRECNTSKGNDTFNWSAYRDEFGFEGCTQ